MLVAAGSAAADAAPAISVGTTSLSATASMVKVSLSSGDFDGYDFAVDYAPAGGEWCSDAKGPHSQTPQQPFNLSPGGSRTTTVQLSGLTPGQDYCTAGVAYYNGRVFDDGSRRWDLGQRPWFFSAGAPNVNPSYAVAPSPTSERLTATIDPLGSVTTYAFEWGFAARDLDSGTSGEQWCDSGGTLGRPLGASASVSLGTETALQHVSYLVTGLATGRQYCWAIHAVNATAAAADFPGGSSSNYSPDFLTRSYSNYFVASDPTVSTGSATQIALRSAVLHLTLRDLDESVVDWYMNLAQAQSPLCRSPQALSKHGRPIYDNNRLPLKRARLRVKQPVGGLRAHTRYCYEAWLHVEPYTPIHQELTTLGQVRYFTTR
jgi:hypothetical protein